MKKILTLILILSIFSSSVWALELKEGKMKLILHEESGRISIFCQNKLISEEYTSLLLSQDPRTSGITLIVNNKTMRMGDTYAFDQTVAETRSGAEFIWESNTLKVSENFSFVTSPKNNISDGVKIMVTIENISEETLSIGMKYLFDTWLGEKNKSRTHFYTSDGAEIDSETMLAGMMPDYWISAKGFNSDTGLLVMLDNESVTQPDNVVFANWKRLDESRHDFKVNSGRNFNLLPYSINDSAVSHYYAPLRVPPGGKRVITLILGNISNEGFINKSLKDNESSLDDLYNRIFTDKADILETEENSVKNELTLTKDLITHIDRLLESNEPMSENEINTLKKMINKLEKTKSKFED